MNAAKILLIEDDAGITDTLQRVLTEEGHEVVTAQRGDDGLARATREVFNVVITDLKLPGLNGLELVRQLHAAQSRLPIILITAFGTTETAIEAMKLGAYDYLLKPFDISPMLDLVRRAGDSNRLMSEPVVLGGTGCPARRRAGGPKRANAGHIQRNWPRGLETGERPHSRRDGHGQGTDRARPVSA